jgi:hypothetical protein
VSRQEALPTSEYTQRSRSFLYAALACVVARLFGRRRVRFFENGVVSINLPISEQVVGARATRTTHPLVMDHFSKFFSAAVGQPIEFDNPFIWKTKADIVRSIVDQGCGDLIKHTVSCTRVRDSTKLHTHCGRCSQCIDRRFAVLAAHADRDDPREMYNVELLTGSRDEAKDQTMAESYVRTALELREIGELGFFSRFGGETARVLRCFASLSADEIGRRVLDLHQRHAQAVWHVLTTAVKTHSDDLVSRRLPPSSVLMMTVSAGKVPELGAMRAGADASRWKDEIETDADVAELPREPDGKHRASGTPVRHEGLPGTRGKSRPSFQRAQRAINDIYGDNLPDQSIEPNTNLCRRIGVKLKEAKLPPVSDDTILRAAGRRK